MVGVCRRRARRVDCGEQIAESPAMKSATGGSMLNGLGRADAGRLANRRLGPVRVAPVLLGQGTDAGHRVVRDLRGQRLRQVLAARRRPLMPRRCSCSAPSPQRRPRASRRWPPMPARAPSGATQAMTGTSLARIAFMMRSMLVSSPPGESISMIAAAEPSSAATRRPSSTKAALTWSMTPVSSSRATLLAVGRGRSRQARRSPTPGSGQRAHDEPWV